MPAERTRGSRRCGADSANQLVWTNPIEPSDQSGIEFTTNLTPVTFTDCVDSDNCPPMFTPYDGAEPSTPRKPGHTKKKPENHIPRPPNAFILFRSSFIKSQHVSSEVETNHSTLSKIIGLTWQNLPEEERKVWHAKAKAVLDEHKRKFPQYAFKPLHSRTKGGGPGGDKEKRKVREVGPKDLKRCAKIAELLVKGKKGSELDVAIQEFDKTHVPEVITRFEAPITARAFRRSSSAPAPDAPSRGPFLQVDPSTPSKRKQRAGSSKPSALPLQRSASMETFGDYSFPPKYEDAASPTLDVSDQLAFPPDAHSFDIDPLTTYTDSVASPPLSIITDLGFTSSQYLSSQSDCASFATPESSAPSTPLYGNSYHDQMPELVDFPPVFDEYSSYGYPEETTFNCASQPCSDVNDAKVFQHEMENPFFDSQCSQAAFEDQFLTNYASPTYYTPCSTEPSQYFEAELSGVYFTTIPIMTNSSQYGLVST